MVWINQLTEKKTPPFSDVDSIYTEVADIVTHDTSHDGKEDTFIGAPDNEIESTETDKGQLISERNFGVFKSPQKRTKFSH